MNRAWLMLSQPDEDEETTMTTEQEHETIEREFNVHEIKSRAAMLIVSTVFLLFVLLFCWSAATAQEARTATITFTAPTQRTDNSTITGALTYEVWQGLKGASKTRVGTISTTNTTVTSGLAGGAEYCWHIVVREAGNAAPSLPSNEACKAFAQSGPNVVTITVT
jgi:hypothetical protein